jgi:hypothetical protein
MPPETERPEVHALIVGIDEYVPQEVPGAPSYPSLGGCVHDALGVRDLLLRLGAKEDHLEVLTATADLDFDHGSPEPPERRPTHANLLAALERLAEKAGPGRQIVFHYSGHGGVAKTRSEAKRRQGLSVDECLVPMDIGEGPEVPYLRDWELAVLIRRMVERRAAVTLLLDCCHSGGLTRGRERSRGQVRTRGIAEVDATERPLSVLPVGVISDIATIVEGAAVRGGQGGTWSPATEGYALLAACGPHQKAMEAVFSGHQSSGAMTYWLLDALAAGGRMSYREVHHRLLGRIHGQFPNQTPILEGEVDRAFLGLDRVPVLEGATVLSGEDDPAGLVLETGSLHAVGKGACFAVYPAGLRSEEEREEVEPVTVLLTEVGPNRSSAEVESAESAQSAPSIDVVEEAPRRRIQTGDRAVLRHTGEASRVHSVRLLQDPGDPEQEPRLEALRRCLEAAESRFVTLETASELPGGGGDGFAVRLDEVGRYRLYPMHLVDQVEDQPLPDVPPTADPEEAVRYLNHLARFANIRSLRNPARGTDLEDQVRIHVWRRPPDWPEDDFTPPETEELPREVSIDDYLYFRITNRSSHALHVAILDLQPGWSIEQVHPPARSAAPYEVVQPGDSLKTWLQIYLPPDRRFERPEDIFQVIAAVDPFNLRSVELGELMEPEQSSAFRDALTGTPDSLQGFVEALAAVPPRVGRHARPPKRAEPWIVHPVKVRVLQE